MDSDIDVRKYTHNTKVETIKLPLSAQIVQVRNHYLDILRIPVERLFNMKVYYERNPEKVSQYMLVLARDKWRNNSGTDEGAAHMIEAQFSVAIALYSSWRLLNTHGLASFKNSIDEFHRQALSGGSRAKKELVHRSEWQQLRQLLEQVTDKGNNHPKLAKLEELLLIHFSQSEDRDTRAMVFVQYRDSVNEIVTLLSEHAPIINPMPFVGQAQGKGSTGKGLTQKEQAAVIKQFRQGGYNTLVATCIGEEGLDIGEVDLIICFDAQASPTRMVQRMGRTGRRREGRCIILLSEGAEEQLYQRSLSKKKSILRTIVDKQHNFQFYGNSPRMIPDGINPVVAHSSLQVPEFQNKESKTKSRKQSDALSKVQDLQVQKKKNQFKCSLQKKKGADTCCVKIGPSEMEQPTSDCFSCWLCRSFQTHNAVD